MYYRGFAEKNSIAELVEEFCNQETKKLNKTCTKPHTNSSSCSVLYLSNETLRKAFESLSTGKSFAETPLFVSHEYDMESEVCRPAATEPSVPNVVTYPFTGPPMYEELAKINPKSGPILPKIKGIPKELARSEPIVIGYASTSKLKKNLKGDSKDDNKEEDGAYSKDERPDSSELATILEEAEEEDSSEKPIDFKKRRAELLKAFDNYRFEEFNPMLDLADPFREAMRKMSEGNITMAIMYLEASVQRRPQYTYPKNYLAWQFLGLGRAANVQDVLAIAAFRECLKIDPNDPDVLLSLAASYANAEQRNLVVETIWNWLYRDPKYCEMDHITMPQDASTMYPPLDIDVHTRVLRMLLVILFKYEDGYMDVNVHTATAIMYSLIGDHTRTIRYFNTAALLNPRDERLWSSLGTSLANYEKHEEAIKAFSNATALAPGYVRARYQWGTSCTKLGAYTDAIKQFLTALNYQTRSVGGLVGKTSDAIWTALLWAVMSHKNPQYVRAVKRRDLKFLNKAFGVVN